MVVVPVIQHSAGRAVSDMYIRNTSQLFHGGSVGTTISVVVRQGGTIATIPAVNVTNCRAVLSLDIVVGVTFNGTVTGSITVMPGAVFWATYRWVATIKKTSRTNHNPIKTPGMVPVIHNDIDTALINNLSATYGSIQRGCPVRKSRKFDSIWRTTYLVDPDRFPVPFAYRDIDGPSIHLVHPTLPHKHTQ
jgi:hypothetical protein